MENKKYEFLLDDEKILFQMLVHWKRMIPATVLIFLLLTLFKSIYIIFGFIICFSWLSFLRINYLQTIYFVTNKRIIKISGVFSFNLKDLSISKIESSSLKISFLGNKFKYGSIIFHGTGGSKFICQDIIEPQKFKKTIEKIKQNPYYSEEIPFQKILKINMKYYYFTVVVLFILIVVFPISGKYFIEERQIQNSKIVMEKDRNTILKLEDEDIEFKPILENILLPKHIESIGEYQITNDAKIVVVELIKSIYGKKFPISEINKMNKEVGFKIGRYQKKLGYMYKNSRQINKKKENLILEFIYTTPRSDYDINDFGD